MKSGSGLFCRKESCTRIFVLRSLVAASLVAAAVLVGAINYVTQSQKETDFAVSQYNSITAQAVDIIGGSFVRMNQGTRVVSKIYRHVFPNETQWPNVALGGFYDVAPEMAEVSALQNIVFSPLVSPMSKAPSFETFMYDHFASEPSYPPFAGYTPAGAGIWALDVNNPDLLSSIYHDTTGYVYSFNTSHNGTLVAPTFQMSLLNAKTVPTLAYNAHSNAVLGNQIDTMMACVSNSPTYEYARNNCTFFGDAVPQYNSDSVFAMPDETPDTMLSFIQQPIVLEKDTAEGVKGQFVGVLGGAMDWKTLLGHSVPNYISGIDVVITTSTTSFTYTMTNGVPIMLGIGDWHQKRYNHRARSINLSEKVPVFTSTTEYTLTFYPRSEFFEPYTTDSPRDTTIGFVCIFIFCSIVFTLYDCAVRRESTRKQEVLDTKRRFVRFISHEMRTPMNTVHLGLKLFQMELEDLVKVASVTAPDKLLGLIRGAVSGWMLLVDDILGNSESAVDVLNDLLNYDKIEQGTLRLEFSAVGIYNVVKKTVNAFMMQAKQKHVDLQLAGDCWVTNSGGDLELGSQFESLVVIGDATRIAQVLRNLLSNALKFTPSEGKVIVDATYVPDGLPEADVPIPVEQQSLLNDPRAGSVRISVTDSGAGLSADQLAQICCEGVQFNANDLQAGGGSGLGLYISKGLAEQHGGSLTVASEGLGKGATFILELPVRRSQLMHLQHTNYSSDSTMDESVDLSVMSTDDARPPEEPAPRRPLNVMIVDDATSNRKLLMRILTAKGYQCHGAEDGSKGVELYQRLQEEGTKVDGIVMDFEMPVMNGPTATKVIREMGCTCFIAGVTGNILPQDVDYFRAQGANTVIAKPLKIDVFESFLATHRECASRSRAEPPPRRAGSQTLIANTADDAEPTFQRREGYQPVDATENV